VFSFLRQLKTWHYPHLLLHVVLQPRAAATPTVQQVIDISYPPGLQQQTRHTLLQRANWTDRGTDTVPFHRPCSALLRGQWLKKNRHDLPQNDNYSWRCICRSQNDDGGDFISSERIGNSKPKQRRLSYSFVRAAILTDRCDCSRQQGFVF